MIKDFEGKEIRVGDELIRMRTDQGNEGKMERRKVTAVDEQYVTLAPRHAHYGRPSVISTAHKTYRV